MVGAITPWNFPHQINLAKIGPALAAGNTVVLKPAPDTPWCAAVLGEADRRAHRFPARRGQHRHVERPQRGGAVGQRPSGGHGFVHRVDGHRPQRDGRRRPRRIKKVFLELGGKSAFIVLDDADLGGAVGIAAVHGVHARGTGLRDHHPAASCRGPNTTRPSRIAAATMGGIKAGDPTDPGTMCGPVISARQRDRVQSYLDSAIAEGGTFACGGGRPAGRDVGFFIEPTVIAGLGNDARCAREEIFGPVLTVIAARRRRRRRAYRQRLAIWIVGHRVWCRPGPGGQGCRADAGGHHQCQRRGLVFSRRTIWWLQAIR